VQYIIVQYATNRRPICKFAAVRAGLAGDLPTAAFAEWPTRGNEIFIATRILRIPLSDKPYFFAKAVSGVSHTSTKISSRLKICLINYSLYALRMVNPAGHH
jgi:hypothetical protein